MLTFVTRSVEETVALGERLGRLVTTGNFVSLVGELGSGKTQFVRGVAAGMGVDPSLHVTSPTYSFLNRYSGRLLLNHFDLYRLTGGQDVADLGFEEYFYGTDVCIVEWADRLLNLLPDERLSIAFDYVDEHDRRISFEPNGEQYEKMIRELAASFTTRFESLRE